MIRETDAATKFEAHFARVWSEARPMIESEPAIRALVPPASISPIATSPSPARMPKTPRSLSGFGMSRRESQSLNDN